MMNSTESVTQEMSHDHTLPPASQFGSTMTLADGRHISLNFTPNLSVTLWSPSYDETVTYKSLKEMEEELPGFLKTHAQLFRMAFMQVRQAQNESPIPQTTSLSSSGPLSHPEDQAPKEITSSVEEVGNDHRAELVAGVHQGLLSNPLGREAPKDSQEGNNPSGEGAGAAIGSEDGSSFAISPSELDGLYNLGPDKRATNDEPEMAAAIIQPGAGHCRSEHAYFEQLTPVGSTTEEDSEDLAREVAAAAAKALLTHNYFQPATQEATNDEPEGAAATGHVYFEQATPVRSTAREGSEDSPRAANPVPPCPMAGGQRRDQDTIDNDTSPVRSSFDFVSSVTSVERDLQDAIEHSLLVSGSHPILNLGLDDGPTDSKRRKTNDFKTI